MLDLEAIKARVAAATKGPWTVHIPRKWATLVATDNDGFITAYIAERIREGEDATFTAHARTDVPALIAEVERLQKENAFLREWLRGNLTLADVDIDEALKQALTEETKDA